MTGFGKSVIELPSKKITVEIKSLNSKQLDLSLRLSSLLREKEMDFRNSISRALERGKVEASVFVETVQGESAVQFNTELLRSYKAQIEAMAADLGLDQPEDWYSLLLRMPDVMKNDSTPEPDPADFEAAETALSKAMEGLMEHRRAEGRKLEEFFTRRIENISNLLNEVPRYETERVERIKARITDNLANLPQVEYDRSRLEQEMIFYIEKLDINEEKQRLAQHLAYFMETMEGKYGQGKKLGFISQEMGREINTLGSKSNHAEMQKIVVKMKDELEQIKEQVLNVL